MIDSLKGKATIITGASKGIGFETLKKFALYKCNVVACSNNKSDQILKRYEQISNKNNIKIYPLFFDLSDSQQIKQSIIKIKEQNLKINFLVNNAGSILNSLIQMTKESDLKKIFQINYFGQFLFTQQVSKILMQSEGSKSIVNVSSSSALDNTMGRAVYSSSKAALISFSETLFKELSKYKIRVNCVAPGLTQTSLMEENTEKKYIQEAINRIALQRVASPEEIANVIVFLCSDLASYINGQTIRVDGGMY